MKINTGYDTEEKFLSLDILDSLDKIFVENNIIYSLAYGTLLGAVRHEGFIPWDDDMDIWVEKKDIQNIIELLRDNREKYCIDIFVPSEHNLIWNEKIKIYSTKSQSKIINNKKYRFPFLDIFGCEIIENSENSYVTVKISNGFFKIGINKTHPTKRVRFENLELPVFFSPIDFLDCHYPKWETIIKTHCWNHRDEIDIQGGIKKYDIKDMNISILDKDSWLMKYKE